MRVLILGAGVIGVTTAWSLRQYGFDVVVVEREREPAMATSFANAGQVSPGYASPWPAPGVPLKALKWLLAPDAPLSIRPTADLAQYAWLWQMWRNCTQARYQVNKARMVRLAEYSRDCLDALRADTGIEYEARRLGTTQLFRTQAQLDAAGKDIEVLRQYAVPHELLDRQGIVQVEPALAEVADTLAGALRLPGDQTGDCHLFTTRLAALAATAGVEFHYGRRVERLLDGGDRLDGVRIDGHTERADHYVLALGCWSPLLLKPLGVSLPIYPLKGYSLTLPITRPEAAPMSTILDETYKVAITRFERRIRVGGMAEVCGYDLSLTPRRRRTLEKVVCSLYPYGGDLAQANFWCGLRPATPDGPPVVGRTRWRNLFLNTGHGTLGWTMACGSARYLSDIIAGRPPQIDGEGLDIARFQPAAAAQAG